jgi:hypothetical protein
MSELLAHSSIPIRPIFGPNILFGDDFDITATGIGSWRLWVVFVV